MIPYWILFGVCAIFALTRIDYQEISARNRAGLGIVLFLISIMIGFRTEVGGDYFSYIRMHNELRNFELFDVWRRTEIGYGLIDWTAGRLGLGTWVVNWACAMIFSWGLWKYLRSNPNPYLGLTIAVPYMVIVVAMGYSRQGAALGFLLAAMANFDRARIGNYILLVCLAVTFHRSAIVMLPVGLLAFTHNRLLSFGLLVLIGFALYYVFVQSAIDRLVNNYVTDAQESQGAFVRVMMCIPPALLVLAWGNRFRFTEDQARFYRNMAIASFVALAALLFRVPSTVVDRLALYIIPLQLVVLTRLVAVFPAERRSAFVLSVGVILIYAGVQFVWLTRASFSPLWIPYKMLWFN